MTARKEPFTLHCLFCDKPIRSPRSNKKFCSDNCKFASWREKQVFKGLVTYLKENKENREKEEKEKENLNG